MPRRGGPGRGAGGRSLSMDVTVSELMELFLQSPLVTWVSAPSSLPHCWCTGSFPRCLQEPYSLPSRGSRVASGTRGTQQVLLAEVEV